MARTREARWTIPSSSGSCHLNSGAGEREEELSGVLGFYKGLAPSPHLHRPEEPGWEGLRPHTHHQELAAARSGAQQTNSKASRAGRLGMVRLRPAPPRAEVTPGTDGLRDGAPWREQMEGRISVGWTRRPRSPERSAFPQPRSHPGLLTEGHPRPGEPCSGPLPKATGSQQTRKERKMTHFHIRPEILGMLHAHLPSSRDGAIPPAPRPRGANVVWS